MVSVAHSRLSLVTGVNTATTGGSPVADKVAESETRPAGEAKKRTPKLTCAGAGGCVPGPLSRQAPAATTAKQAIPTFASRRRGRIDRRASTRLVMPNTSAREPKKKGT